MKLDLLKEKNVHATIKSNKKNLHDDAWTLVILLKVGAIEPNGAEVTFHGSFEGLNANQV